MYDTRHVTREEGKKYFLFKSLLHVCKFKVFVKIFAKVMGRFIGCLKILVRKQMGCSTKRFLNLLCESRSDHD